MVNRGDSAAVLFGGDGTGIRTRFAAPGGANLNKRSDGFVATQGLSQK